MIVASEAFDIFLVDHTVRMDMQSRFRRVSVGVVALLGAALLAAPAVAEPQKLWAKAATPGATMLTDFKACMATSKDVRPYVPYSGRADIGNLGPVGSSMAVAIAVGLEMHDARTAYIRHCMHAHGYHPVRMSGDEIERYRALGADDERAAWVDKTYATPGFAQRLQAALNPPVPPLPEAETGPGAIGAVKLDPAALQPASGVVVAGQPALTGQAAHRLTAKVRERAYVTAGIELPADTVMHQMVGPSDVDPDQTFWCAPVKFHALIGYTKTARYCVWFDDDGYATDAYDGFDWLAVDTSFGIVPSRTATGALSLDLSDADLIGAMDFSLVVAKIDTAAATLKAQATMNGETAVVWRGRVPFGQNGEAVLPFWTHRVVLQRSGAGVTVTYPADGDGEPPAGEAASR